MNFMRKIIRILTWDNLTTRFDTSNRPSAVNQIITAELGLTNYELSFWLLDFGFLILG
jgi:hypothetical protein